MGLLVIEVVYKVNCLRKLVYETPAPRNGPFFLKTSKILRRFGVEYLSRYETAAWFKYGALVRAMQFFPRYMKCFFGGNTQKV